MPDIDYDRPTRPRQYLSINKHQRTATSHYNKWICINTEKQVFDNADYGSISGNGNNDAWLDTKGNLWGFLELFEFVGLDYEQFGYFEDPCNPVLKWHGFPVIPFSESRYVICDELLLRWVNEGLLDEDDIPTLKNKRRIR